MPEPRDDEELDDEYDFDYSKARSNRFAAALPRGGRVIVLDPDVAEVFTDPDQVNAVLRALITTMPKSA
jgi:hypothetical protein